ncbi:MAG: hypothetical protein ACKVHE_17260 [Planctomycetales bacterium]
MGKRILRQSTRLSAGIVPAGGWLMSGAVASRCRTTARQANHPLHAIDMRQSDSLTLLTNALDFT